MAIDKEEMTWAESIRKDTDMGSVQQLVFYPKKGSHQKGHYTAFVTAPFFLWLPGEIFRAFTFNFIKPKYAKFFTNVTSSRCSIDNEAAFPFEAAVYALVHKALSSRGVPYTVLTSRNEEKGGLGNADIKVYEPQLSHMVNGSRIFTFNDVNGWYEYQFDDLSKFWALVALNGVLVFIATVYGVWGSFKLVFGSYFIEAMDMWDDYMPRSVRVWD